MGRLRTASGAQARSTEQRDTDRRRRQPDHGAGDYMTSASCEWPCVSAPPARSRMSLRSSCTGELPLPLASNSSAAASNGHARIRGREEIE
eukprot:scaffold111559_cov36-Tisochrysis_lutea.AAC.4